MNRRESIKGLLLSILGFAVAGFKSEESLAEEVIPKNIDMFIITDVCIKDGMLYVTKELISINPDKILKLPLISKLTVYPRPQGEVEIAP